MQYMGGKSRIAKSVVSTILQHRGERAHYLEPFVGGAFIFPLVAQHFSTAVGSDVMPDVVELWAAVRDGWIPPEELSRDEWSALRHAGPSALRAFAGFGCSFGGRFFRGYAEDDPRPGRLSRAGAARRGILKKAAGLRGAHFVHCDYRQWSPGPDVVVYCDPPYAGTEPFAQLGEWDSGEFWITVERWARGGAAVLVSEYRAPERWRPVWSAPVKSTLGRESNTLAAMESVFMWDGGS